MVLHLKYGNAVVLATLLCVSALVLACGASPPSPDARELKQDPDYHGWKSIHVWVGNETADSSSIFYSAPDSNLHPKSHSQVGQDMTVFLLTEGRPGFFVDLAANDAVSLSNTLMLERDLDWQGLCIEPNPGYWKDLARRKCKLVAAVVGHTKNAQVEFVAPGAGWNGGQVNGGQVPPQTA